MKLLFFLIIPVICFSQGDSYRNLVKLPKSEFQKAVGDSIIKLESGDLWSFLKVLKDDYKKDLKTFNEEFIKKMEDTKRAMDMHFLLGLLIEQKTDQVIIENILNRKIEVWDKGQWSEKFWKVIREHKLVVKENSNYSINEKGQKRYNIRAFLEEKIKNDEIGLHPLLDLDYRVTDYEPNKLLETLEKMNIKDIQIISREEGIKLYGKRGVDGMIKVLTR